ncbi:ParB N-terminal domain-containing protein, partial [Candidatus Pelagibacter bacterium]
TKKTKNKIFYISPKLVQYCIFPSKYCDYTQFNSSTLHPHAGQDRGVFKEDPLGNIKINNSDWDYKPGVLFTKLLEYEALKNHYRGKENWTKSKFALRNVNYIKKSNQVRGFTDYNIFLSEREKQIDKLFKSILKKGISPVDITKDKKLFIDNISLAITKDNKLYFNNRGHHRLSIAKILGLKEIPVKITVTKSIKNLKSFISSINNC